MRSATVSDARELDGREVDGAPFGVIVAVLEARSAAETFVPVNGSEPTPLYAGLEQREGRVRRVPDFGRRVARVAPVRSNTFGTTLSWDRRRPGRA